MAIYSYSPGRAILNKENRMIVLMVYLAVAGVLFLMCFLSYAFVTEAEEKTYSLIEKLINSAAAPLLWPALLIGALILLVMEVREHYSKSDGPTCGFCNAYYYRQLPGYVAPVVNYKKEVTNGEQSSEIEYMKIPDYLLNIK
jgi:hypothetical protein